MEKNWIGARAFFLMSLIWVLATLGCRLNDNKIRGHIGNSPETPPATPGIEKPFSCADFPEETSYRAFGKGIGADPFLICNPRQLDSLGNSASSLDWDKSYKLLQDIDLSEFDSNDFHLIGTSATPFSGEFDGNGKALSGLSFTASGEDDIGLFRAVNGARIHDLKLDGFYFNGGSGSNVGTLIGKAYGVGASLYNIEIANSEVRGSGATLGGLVGYHLGLANQIFLQVTVHSTGDNVGGFAGRLYGTCGSIYPSTVSHISGNVTIEGGNRVGGLLGWAVGANCTGSIQHSEVGGAVTGIDNVGGMVGFFDYMKSSFNLTSTATVTGVNHVGGALGYMKSTRADQLAAEGDVSASGDFVGGLVGTLYYVPGGVSPTVFDSYALGDVVGANSVGGLVGQTVSFSSQIIQSYAQGKVTATGSNAGSLVGLLASGGQITRSYALGLGGVTGTNAGGLVGNNSGTISASYFDKVSSGQTNMCGVAGGTGCNNSFGKTAVEMQSSSTFMASQWDFLGEADLIVDVWKMDSSGYPILWWQNLQLSEIPSFSGGTGVADDPYLISLASELNSISSNPRLMTAHFRLINDIDMTTTSNYNMMGSSDYPFQGVLDGAGHELSHLTINLPGLDSVGLFSVTDSTSLISNLNLTVVNITGKYGVGALVGTQGGGIIEDVTVEGTVGGTDGIGGVVGISVGGILRRTQSININVNGSSSVGGLAGITDSWVSQSSSSGTVTGGDQTGGLVGEGYGLIEESHSTADVVGTATDHGGLVGYLYNGIVSKSYATGSVSGNLDVGGLVGYNRRGTVKESFASGQVTGPGGGSSTIGGLVGFSSLTSRIENSYARGDVSGSDQVGGLVGYFYNQYLINSYSTGQVTGSTSVGGFVGMLNSSGLVLEKCFWDKTINPALNDTGSSGDQLEFFDATTAAMKDNSATIYLDQAWDFATVWKIDPLINDGYPSFLWQE